MTPEQEDALYQDNKAMRESGASEYTCFLVAIRAAVAAERERCAKVCEEHEPKSFTTDGMITRAMCAAAIRRGP